MLDKTQGAVLVRDSRKRKHFCWVDRKHMIVVCGRQAIRLGAVEFAIFDAIHKNRVLGKTHAKHMHRLHGKTIEGRVIGSHQLYEKVYRGAANPPGLNVFGATIRNINLKLEYLGLKIVGRNHHIHSYYELIDLKKPVAEKETHNLPSHE